jgi:hypothetical protein
MAEAVLLKEVEGLGEAGDAVEVSPGYLRNYLVPRKLAQPEAFATKDYRAILDRKDIDAVMIGPNGQPKVIEVKMGLSGLEDAYYLDQQTGEAWIDLSKLDDYAVVSLAMQMLSGWEVVASLLKDPAERIKVQESDNPVLYRKIDLTDDSEFELLKQHISQVEMEI